MSIYSDKLAHVQVIISCRYSVAQLCTREDRLAYKSGAPSILMTSWAITRSQHYAAMGLFINYVMLTERMMVKHYQTRVSNRIWGKIGWDLKRKGWNLNPLQSVICNSGLQFTKFLQLFLLTGFFMGKEKIKNKERWISSLEFLSKFQLSTESRASLRELFL